MTKKNLFLLLFISLFFMCRAQEEEKYYDANTELDTACFYFKKLTRIDFDVSQKNGCEFLITQLLNQTAYFSRDTLYYQWSVFNDDRSIYFVFDEENPDLFLYESGNYHIELIINNLYGCSDTLTKYNMISIDKMPQVNFTFTPENALFGEYFGEVVFTNLTDPELLNDSTTTWYWDMGDHVMNRFEQSPVHLFSMWGDYHTTFHLQTKNGCKVALTKTVTIENELFFPDTLKNNSPKFPSIFAVTNLNTYIPKDDPNGFRTNYLFVYDKTGKQIYEQKNYDTYIKNKNITKGNYTLSTNELDEGEYFYSFYYKGKNKMVHYCGNFWVKM